MAGVHGVTNNENIFSGEIFLELAGHCLGNSGKGYSRFRIDSALERHDQAIIKNAMNRARPLKQRGAKETKFRADLFIKCMEDDVHRDRVRFGSVNSGRVQEVRNQAIKPCITPARELVCKVPPKKPQKMRSGNGGNLVPNGFPGGGSNWICLPGTHYRQVCHALRIKVYFGVVKSGQTLEQFREHTLRAVLLVQKWADEGEGEF